MDGSHLDEKAIGWYDNWTNVTTKPKDNWMNGQKWFSVTIHI